MDFITQLLPDKAEQIFESNKNSDKLNPLNHLLNKGNYLYVPFNDTIKCCNLYDEQECHLTYTDKNKLTNIINKYGTLDMYIMSKDYTSCLDFLFPRWTNHWLKHIGKYKVIKVQTEPDTLDYFLFNYTDETAAYFGKHVGF